MANRTIPVGEALRFGWETFQNNVFFLIGIFVAKSVATSILGLVADVDPIENSYLGIPLGLATIAVNFLLDIGVIAIVLQFADGKRPEFGDLFNRVSLVLKYGAAAVLYALMVFFGLFLFILPGIYLAVRFCFFGYFIADVGAGPIEALKMSSDLTQGVRMELFAFGLLMAVILFIGLCAFLIGVWVAMPITSVATAYVFRYLQVPPPGREAEVLTRAA